MEVLLSVNIQGFHTILVKTGRDVTLKESFKNQDLKSAAQFALQAMVDNNVQEIEIEDPGRQLLRTSRKARLTRKQMRLYV